MFFFWGRGGSRPSIWNLESPFRISNPHIFALSLHTPAWRLKIVNLESCGDSENRPLDPESTSRRIAAPLAAAPISGQRRRSLSCCSLLVERQQPELARKIWRCCWTVFLIQTCWQCWAMRISFARVLVRQLRFRSRYMRIVCGVQ